MRSGFLFKLSELRFGRLKILFGKFPWMVQPNRLREVKEEDRFIKQPGLTDDMFIPLRISSLTFVRLWTIPSTVGSSSSRVHSEKGSRGWLQERSSEINFVKCEISFGTLPENQERERLRWLNLAKRPNSDGILDLWNKLPARFSLCKCERRKRLLFDKKVPRSQLQLKSRPITWPVIVSQVIPSHEQQSVPSFQELAFGYDLVSEIHKSQQQSRWWKSCSWIVSTQ